jgi:hypothetical protein
MIEITLVMPRSNAIHPAPYKVTTNFVRKLKATIPLIRAHFHVTKIGYHNIATTLKRLFQGAEKLEQ